MYTASCVLAGCCAISLWLAGCATPGELPKLRVFHLGQEESLKGVFAVLPEQVEEWEKCFPGYRDLPDGGGNGFFASYLVYFECENGLSYRIHTDGTNWSNGKGTFPVSGNIDDLFRRTYDFYKLNHPKKTWNKPVR